jgi:hypothetical protein
VNALGGIFSNFGKGVTRLIATLSSRPTTEPWTDLCQGTPHNVSTASPSLFQEGDAGLKFESRLLFFFHSLHHLQTAGSKAHNFLFTHSVEKGILKFLTVSVDVDRFFRGGFLLAAVYWRPTGTLLQCELLYGRGRGFQLSETQTLYGGLLMTYLH